MILWLIRFFRGWVTFSINGRFPERFINLSMKSGIGIFGATPEGGTLTASVVVSDYRCIRPVARRSGVRLKVLRRHGLPFKIHRHRKRWGLAAGAVLFICLIFLLQNFVWTIEINGAETLSKSAVLSSLKEQGLTTGRFIHTLDLHRIERQLQLEFDEIGWMSINLTGTCADVEIKEKAQVPESRYSSGFSNIKASADGVIISADVRRGTAAVSVGSAVSKGQLLVGGMYENALGELHYVDADADVFAETKYNFEASVKKQVTALLPAELSKRQSLAVLWLRLPVSFTPEHSPFTSYTETSQLCLSGNPVPVTLSTQHLISFTPVTRTLSEREAEKILRSELALYKLFTLQNVATLSESTEIREEEAGFKITSELKCSENIALKENLIVNPE